MTTNSSNSNDGQQVSQQLQHEWSTLPLVHLPYELAEETSLYFEPMEAARVLSVNRAFYSLFIPRVWYDLESCYQYGDKSNFEKWFKKYGQYVRLVDPLLSDVIYMEPAIDWIPFVNKATRLSASLYTDSPLNEVSMVLQCLREIKSLRIVYLRVDGIPTTGMEVVELARAFNELEVIYCIDILFQDDTVSNSREYWVKIIEFVEALHPSKRAKLKLTMNFDNSVTTQHVRALAPYLVELNVVANRFQPSTINETRNILGGNSVSAVGVDTGYGFPRLEKLVMEFCRLHQRFYDFKDVTPARIPRLRQLSFVPRPCNPDDYEQESASDVGQIWKPKFSNYAHVVVPSHHWPNLVHLHIGVISSERLMNIINLNPQLQDLTINPGMLLGEKSTQNSAMFSVENFSHDVFKIDEILDQLPRLRIFTIAKLHAVVDAGLGSTPLERHRGITVEIGSQMAVTPVAIKHVLQMQQLTGLTFHQFVFTDVDKTINILRDCDGSCGVRWFSWHPIDWNQELALAMTAKMPKLDFVSVQSIPKMYRAYFKDRYNGPYLSRRTKKTIPSA
ncbi:hypothetical protein GQ42DRAFT_30406 [Ramicandelaber brevisporus]|nr:hypothetical protein GQ42DRAFT_30406 [Ramicandelaber brevisporus]